MKHAMPILVVIFGTAIMFIVIAFGDAMFGGKTSRTFQTVMAGGETVDVVIMTSSSYAEKDWKQIEQIIILPTKLSNNITRLNEQLPKLLEIKGYSVIGFLMSKQVEVIIVK